MRKNEGENSYCKPSGRRCGRPHATHIIGCRNSTSTQSGRRGRAIARAIYNSATVCASERAREAEPRLRTPFANAEHDPFQFHPAILGEMKGLPRGRPFIYSPDLCIYAGRGGAQSISGLEAANGAGEHRRRVRGGGRRKG